MAIKTSVIRQPSASGRWHCPLPVTNTTITVCNIQYSKLRVCWCVDVAHPTTDYDDLLAIWTKHSCMTGTRIDGSNVCSDSQVCTGSVGLLDANEGPALFWKGEERYLGHVDEGGTGVASDEDKVLLLYLRAITSVGKGGRKTSDGEPGFWYRRSTAGRYANVVVKRHARICRRL
jgi:hypothetical protein